MREPMFAIKRTVEPSEKPSDRDEQSLISLAYSIGEGGKEVAESVPDVSDKIVAHFGGKAQLLDKLRQAARESDGGLSLRMVDALPVAQTAKGWLVAAIARLGGKKMDHSSGPALGYEVSKGRLVFIDVGTFMEQLHME
jgi:hypothetical protein